MHPFASPNDGPHAQRPMLAEAFALPLASRAQPLYWHCAPIHLDPDWVRHCHGLLSADEQRRSSRYVSSALSDRYSASRGAMRHLLGDFTGTAPHTLAFTRGRFGKPGLAGPDGAACAFNFSDNEGHWAACMHGDADLALGIDIEAARRFEGADGGLVQLILGPDEYARWRAAPQASQAAALCRVWTGKEAVLKAIGTGLQRNMREFDIGWAPGPRAVSLADMAGRPATWQVHDLHPLPDGLIGCVAVNAA